MYTGVVAGRVKIVNRSLDVTDRSLSLPFFVNRESINLEQIKKKENIYTGVMIRWFCEMCG